MKLRNKKIWNQLYLLHLIRACGRISQAELAHMGRLQPSTVSNLMKDLKNSGMVWLSGKGESGELGGKKSDLLSLNGEFAVFSGIFLKQDALHITTVDFAGNVLQESELSITEHGSGPVTDIIVQLLHDTGRSYPHLRGAGISVQSVVNYGGDIAESMDFNWALPHFSEILGEKIPQLSLSIENDANCSAFHARILLKGEYRNFLTFSVYFNPFTLGAGIIINNELYKGVTGAAGEIWESRPWIWRELNNLREKNQKYLTELPLFADLLKEIEYYIISSAVFLDSPLTVMDGDFARMDNPVKKGFKASVAEQRPGHEVLFFDDCNFTIKGAVCMSADKFIEKIL